jgi:hypothetical protein
VKAGKKKTIFLERADFGNIRPYSQSLGEYGVRTTWAGFDSPATTKS